MKVPALLICLSTIQSTVLFWWAVCIARCTYGSLRGYSRETCSISSWAFFHSSLSPAIEIGGTWPPLGITPLDPFAIPVRPLITIMPVALTTLTKLTLCKSTDLPTIEMRRGPEHVCKVEKQTSYKNVIGEINFIHGLIIHPSHNAKLSLKVTDTNLFNSTIEKVYVVESLLNRTDITYVKMRPTDRISDIIIRTGDRLREAIPILDIKANNYPK